MFSRKSGRRSRLYCEAACETTESRRSILQFRKRRIFILMITEKVRWIETSDVKPDFKKNSEE